MIVEEKGHLPKDSHGLGLMSTLNPHPLKQEEEIPPATTTTTGEGAKRTKGFYSMLWRLSLDGSKNEKKVVMVMRLSSGGKE